MSRPVDPATSNALSGEQSAKPDMAGSGASTATSLSPSASWEVSEQSGDFSWSYPLRVPPAPGGFEPDLALGYRSSIVDGRTSAVNNQPSWVGEGWDLSVGFVERSYGSCASDSDGGTVPPKTGDLCWRSDNATAAYDGGGGMLIRNGNGDWRVKGDDGSRVERLSGAANGDDGDAAANRGEYWRITTVDGTQYLFGSQADSGATWTVPVFGDDDGEPCHATTYDASHCVQAYRWNLDKVIDSHGNVIKYFYDTESNNYGMNVKDTAVSYIRGGTLRRIDYGLNDNVNAPASAQVEFTTADRCVQDSVCSFDRPANWPDTALDQRCVTATCRDHYSPTFWSTKRLASVTTKVRDGGGFRDVERWTLTQAFPDPGDGEKAALWLKSITNTGLAGTPITLPSVTFEGSQLANRVYAAGDGYAPLVRYRLTGIVSESGGVTSINYLPAECTSTAKPSAPESNTMRCFPMRWAEKNSAERTDYFQKYVVGKMIQSDELASSAQQVTSYEYLDGAAWHFDTSELTKEDKKTWSEFRGFGRVRVRTGVADDPGGPKTMTEQRFYRGMHGDKLPNGTRPVRVSDSDGGSHDDLDWLRGFGYETITYDKEVASTLPNPPVVTKTITDPVWQGPTATRGAYNAYIVRPGTERGFTALSGGGWRLTKATSTYDDRGVRTMVDDRGDLATTADDQCTRTNYVRNTAKWLLDLPSTEETVSVGCDVVPRFPEHAVSAERSSYDAKAPGAAPDTGNLTRTDIAKERPATQPDYVTTAGARYDVYGRIIEYTDAMGKPAKVEFTPAVGGPVASTKITSASAPDVPLGLVTTTTVETAFGQPTMVVDPNGRVSETAYDALGRKTEVWLPNRYRDESAGNFRFSYQIRKDGPTTVSTSKVGPNGIYTTSNTIYDGLMRVRQVQQPAVGGGRLIADTRYDSHGRAFKTTQPYFNNAAVDGNLWVAADTEVPGLTRTEFDGAGREVEQIYQSGATNRWRTSTRYSGDRVSTTPPKGQTATTLVSNAQGKPVELQQHLAATATGAFDPTQYRYTAAGKLAEVTGADGKSWKFGYDLRGRKISSDDPDRGHTTMTYDNADRLTSVTDARGKAVFYAYDSLGRKTSIRQDREDGPKLTEWKYDTASYGKGLLASATRFVDGKPYVASIGSYNALDAPVSNSITIPAGEAFAGTYTSFLGYGADGSLTGESYPAIGGLPEETVNYGLDDAGRPKTVTVGSGTKLVASSAYTRYGELERIEQGATGKRSWQTFYYDSSNRRLTRSIVDAEVPAPMQSDINYGYDDGGNITSIVDNTPGAQEIQCFQQDHVRRLTNAWTPTATTGCAVSPSTGSLTGPAPYWNSYTYDKGGNRVTETQRTSATNTSRTYAYPANQPHTIDTITGPSGTETYDYDAAGNTISRVKGGVGETMAWDVEGRLASSTKNGQTTSFAYTADGDRLLREDSASVTLYIGKQEVKLSGGTATGTRYYTHGEDVVAVRQNQSVSYLAGDHQGTAQLAISTNTMAVARRRQVPFGAPRGTTPSWPSERGFVGGTQDPATGLSHLGARDYDPSTGRFISIDPLMNLTDPQQLHGYGYSSSNPVSESDPTGLCSGPDGIGCRSRLSKEGFGDMRDPANEARYEAHRNTWKANVAKAQRTLRNGNGVRCPDGEKTCRPVSGAATKADLERRQREERAKKLETQLNNTLPKEARGWFGVTNLVDFQTGSVCVEAEAGMLFAGALYGCVNWDNDGITYSSGVKIGVELGGGAHVVGVVRLSMNAKANEVDQGVSASADIGFRAGAILSVGASTSISADTKGSVDGTVEFRLGLGAELSIASASVGFGFNSGYLRW